MKKSLSFAMDTIEDCDSAIQSIGQKKRHCESSLVGTLGDRTLSQVLEEIVIETRQTRTDVQKMIGHIEALLNNHAAR